MRGPADLTAWRREEDFRDDPVPMAVLDGDLVLRAVNTACEQATGFTLAQLESRYVFEAFPANPQHPEGDDGPTCMAASYERVLRDGEPHDLVVQRYDIPDAQDPERFTARMWLPQNLPVWSATRQVGVATRAEPVEVPERAMRVLRRWRDALREAAASPDPDTAELVDSIVWGLREYSGTTRELGQLRQALTSRATIDQAKGVLMAQRHISPEEAFRLLVKLSNDSNVRVADVARALVYQTGRPRNPA